MHFSKTYAQLLLTLPPELRESAIQYRQLKKIINQIVVELTALGLSPDVLQGVVQPTSTADSEGKENQAPSAAAPADPSFSQSSGPRVIYELANGTGHVEPRLHLYLDDDDILQLGLADVTSLSQRLDIISLPISKLVLQLALPPPSSPHCQSLEEYRASDIPATEGDPPAALHELIIPLASDTAFFRTLSEALEALSAHLQTRRIDFEATLQGLSRDISSAARPSSSTSTFQPYSRYSSDPSNISVPSTVLALNSLKSDLDTWREIFQMYVEADIFQGHQERFRGERDLKDAEMRLDSFSSKLQDRISEGVLKLRLKQSKVALKTFMELNTFILDLRKFQQVTSEATRKILKKHAKRTALPLAPDLASPFTVSNSAIVLAQSSRPSESLSLSLLLVQALTETLLPIIPHIEDYSCVICTCLAFKPIRLRCSHLFCVRCLVKLQKRGEQHCPMCRALTVLSADRSNVDWALLNFMKDWFPLEAKKKLCQNEREAAEEEIRELGLDTRGCIVV